MKDRVGLTVAELASLDLLITVAQQRGKDLDDQIDNTQEQAEAQADAHEAMWEARHGGLELSDRDRETLGRIRELAATLEIAPTLRQLVELRGAALSGRG
jgi:hypothetical protein